MLLNLGYGSPEYLDNELDMARRSLGESAHSSLPIGVGFLGWQLDSEDNVIPPTLVVALKHRVRAIWFAFGENMGRWIKQVHTQSTVLGDHKPLIFVQITSVAEARVALEEWNVDAIVVQGK